MFDAEFTAPSIYRGKPGSCFHSRDSTGDGAAAAGEAKAGIIVVIYGDIAETISN